jgi:outer membrane receptor protein involved in Fe transport
MLLKGNASLLAAAVTLALGSQAGQAQGTTADEPAALDEIVVTARKREESLQDVPLSVTAVASQDILERNIRDARDLAQFTPGFSYSSAFGRNNLERPVIRGQSNILGEPNASFFVDGVYITGPVVQTEVANLERIEIIKGPQAALYGRATFAGAINYVTKRPSEEFSGGANVTLGQHDQVEADAFISGPLVQDKLFYYLAARHYEFGGEFTNFRTGRKYGDERTDGVTAKLLWKPVEGTEVSWLTTYAEDDDGHAVLAFQGREFNNCQLRSVALPRSPGYRCGEAVDIDQLIFGAATDLFPADGVGVQRERIRTALQLNTQFAGGYELAASASYNDEDQATGYDVSYGGFDLFATAAPVPVLAANAQGNAARQYLANGSGWRLEGEDREDFSAELRFSSPQEERFRWLAGAFYFKGNNDNVRNDKIYPDRTIVPNGQAALTVRKTENRAAFGAIEFDATDRLTVTAEVRYAEDELFQQSYQLPSLAQLAPLVPAATTAMLGPLGAGTVAAYAAAGAIPVGAINYQVAQTFGETFKSTTPRVTLRYELSEDATFYFNFAKGNKPGGFNTGVVVPLLLAEGLPIPFDEEEVDAYEIGGKFQLFDGRARVNVAVFRNDLFNQQLTQNIVGGSPPVANSFIQNVGETLIQGLELEVQARLAEGWDVSLGYAYVDAEIKEYVLPDQAALFSSTPARVLTAFSNTNPFGCLPAAPGTTVATPAGRATCAALVAADNAAFGDVAGNRPPRAPEHQGFISSRYGRPLNDNLTWFVGGDVTYEGSKYDQVHNLIETGDRTSINARLGLESESWSVFLWGRNLGDDDTPVDILRYVDARPPLPAFTPAELAAGVSPFIAGANNPRGFAVTPPRGRQVGITATYRF